MTLNQVFASLIGKKYRTTVVDIGVRETTMGERIHPDHVHPHTCPEALPEGT